MAVGLNVTVEQANNKSILRLQGRLDATSVPLLEKKFNDIIDQNQRKFLVDFARVDYLSSAGLRLLLAISKKLRARGGLCALCNMADEVLDIIKMAGFEKILQIYSTEKDGLAALE